MAKFFKGTDKRPFTYTTIIEERKGSRNYTVWVIGGVILVIVLGSVFFYLR